MYGWNHYFNVKQYDVHTNMFPVPCHWTNCCALIVVKPTHVAIWCTPYVRTDEEQILFLSSLIYFVYIFRSKLNYHYLLSTFVDSYTGYTQKNGAVSEINKKCISHLTRAQRTPSAAATVQVSHALQQFASHAYCGAAPQQEKAFCVLRFEVSRSVITVQRQFRTL